LAPEARVGRLNRLDLDKATPDIRCRFASPAGIAEICSGCREIGNFAISSIANNRLQTPIRQAAMFGNRFRNPMEGSPSSSSVLFS
jgi:hypothetical protein